VIKGGIIHSRERVEKMNHTRCDIENICKSETATQKVKGKCTKKISCPVEEEKKEKSVQNCRMHTKGPGSRGKTKKSS
jgi:hypothetical protein